MIATLVDQSIALPEQAGVVPAYEVGVVPAYEAGVVPAYKAGVVPAYEAGLKEKKILNFVLPSTWSNGAYSLKNQMNETPLEDWPVAGHCS